MHLHATNWFTNLPSGRGETLVTDVFTQVIIIRHMGGTSSGFVNGCDFTLNAAMHGIDLSVI